MIYAVGKCQVVCITALSRAINGREKYGRERIKLHCLGDSIEGARICMESEPLCGGRVSHCMESLLLCVWRVSHSVCGECVTLSMQSEPHCVWRVSHCIES